MKIGMNMLLWTTQVRSEHYPLLSRLRQVGFDGVEIPVMDITDPASYAVLRRVVEDHGLECTASSAIAPDWGSPLSPDRAMRIRALDHLRRTVDCTAALGSGLLIGPLYQVIGVFSGTAPSEREKEHVAQVHHALGQHAEAVGVRVALEPLNRFEAHFMNSAAQALEHVQRVGHPWIGAMYDTFHAHIEEEDPVEALAPLQAAQRLVHVHISENNRGVPGRGHARLAATIRKLHSLGYDGWLTIEAFGQSLPALADATRIWRRMFESEQQVYEEGYEFVRGALG